MIFMCNALPAKSRVVAGGDQVQLDLHSERRENRCHAGTERGSPLLAVKS
jgi:hypothetical protein